MWSHKILMDSERKWEIKILRRARAGGACVPRGIRCQCGLAACAQRQRGSGCRSLPSRRVCRGGRSAGKVAGSHGYSGKHSVSPSLCFSGGDTVQGGRVPDRRLRMKWGARARGQVTAAPRWPGLALGPVSRAPPLSLCSLCTCASGAGVGWGREGLQGEAHSVPYGPNALPPDPILAPVCSGACGAGCLSP